MRPFWRSSASKSWKSRYTLLFSAAALFSLGWLFVYFTSLNETEILRQLGSGEGGGRIQFLRYLGVAKEPASVELVAGILEPSVDCVVDLDLDDQPGLGRGCRRGGARHDGPDPVSPRCTLGLSRLSGVRGGPGAGDPGGCLAGGYLDRPAVQHRARAAEHMDPDSAHPQSRRPGLADLRIHPPGLRRSTTSAGGPPRSGPS